MRYLDRGSYLDVDTGIYNSTALHVLATRPVLVAQFCKSYSADDVRFSDPFMALIPPMTQYTPVLVTSIFTSLMGNAYINYLMIVVPTIGREALRLNGRTLPEELILDEVRYVLGTVYTTLTVRLPDLDSAMFTITDGVADFGVIQYGLKFQESYGMLAGQGLDPLPVTCLVTAVQWRDGIDNDCDGVADEEIANGIDDDGDSLIDEDVWDDKSSHPVEVEGYDVVLTIRPHVRVVPTTADTVGPSTVQSLKTTTRNFYTTFDHDDDDAAYTTDTTSTELDTTHVTSATFPQTSTRMYSTQTQTRLSTGITERTTSPENAEETSGIPERSETVQKPTETIVQRTSETLEESPTTSPFPRTSHHSDGTTLMSTLFTSDKSSTEDVKTTSYHSTTKESTTEKYTIPVTHTTSEEEATTRSPLPTSPMTTSAKVDVHSNFLLDNLAYFIVPGSIIVGIPVLCLLYFAVGAIMEYLQENRVVHPERNKGETSTSKSRTGSKHPNSTPHTVTVKGFEGK